MFKISTNLKKKSANFMYYRKGDTIRYDEKIFCRRTASG